MFSYSVFKFSHISVVGEAYIDVNVLFSAGVKSASADSADLRQLAPSIT